MLPGKQSASAWQGGMQWETFFTFCKSCIPCPFLPWSSRFHWINPTILPAFMALMQVWQMRSCLWCLSKSHLLIKWGSEIVSWDTLSFMLESKLWNILPFLCLIGNLERLIILICMENLLRNCALTVSHALSVDWSACFQQVRTQLCLVSLL